jgi:hypothetical protein
MGHETLKTAWKMLCRINPRSASKGSLNPSKEQVGNSLIKRAASFVGALMTAGSRSELERRADAFVNYTAGNGGFDMARIAAHRVLADPRVEGAGGSRKDYYLPDVTRPRRNNRRVFDLDGFEPDHRAAFHNYVPVACGHLADRTWLFWNVENALHDVRLLLQLDLSDADAKILHDWQGALWKLARSSERHHSWGCFLLRECYSAMDPLLPGPERYEALVIDVEINYLSAVKSIKDAATDLYAACIQHQTLRGGRLRAPAAPEDQSEATDHKRVFHGPDALVPPEYAYGPLTGNLTELATAICFFAGQEERPRGLLRLAVKRDIWLVRQEPRGHTVNVFFRNSETRSKANDRLMRIREEQKRARKGQRPPI